MQKVHVIIGTAKATLMNSCGVCFMEFVEGVL